MPPTGGLVHRGLQEDGHRPGDVVAHDEQTRKLVEIYANYDDQCQREGVVDFAELMLRSYELLRDNAAIREHYQHRFRHILVDEFQDTNKLQYAWLKMFCAAGQPPGPKPDRGGRRRPEHLCLPRCARGQYGRL